MNTIFINTKALKCLVEAGGNPAEAKKVCNDRFAIEVDDLALAKLRKQTPRNATFSDTIVAVFNRRN